MEHKFAIPSKLLMTDIFREETGYELFILDGDLIVAGDCTRKQAEDALAAHNPVDTAAIAQAAREAALTKLAALGLTTEDLKALGL